MKNFKNESNRLCEMYTSQSEKNGDYSEFIGDLLWIDRYDDFTRLLMQFGGPGAGFDVCNETQKISFWRAWDMEYFEITILDNDFIDFVLEFIENGVTI